MSIETKYGFRMDKQRFAKSKHFVPSDKILDEKTYRLRFIMKAAAALVTSSACLSRILLPFAAMTCGIYSLVGHVPNALAFAGVTLPSFALCMANAYLSHDIAKRVRNVYFDKPELVYSDDAALTRAKESDQGHDLLFHGLRACYAGSPENIWFQSLVLECTHASPILKSWKAICTGLQLGLKHNVLRSFISLPPSGEQIVFRLDNAGYRSPIQLLDRYGRMGVTEDNLQDADAWMALISHHATSSHSHRRRHMPAGETVAMLSVAARSTFSRFALPRLASFRRRSASAARRPAR